MTVDVEPAPTPRLSSVYECNQYTTVKLASVSVTSSCFSSPSTVYILRTVQIMADTFLFPDTYNTYTYFKTLTDDIPRMYITVDLCQYT